MYLCNEVLILSKFFMSVIDENGTQLSPCICSYARFALGLKLLRPQNNKKCSYNYWLRVINHLSRVHNLNTVITSRAYGKYIDLIEKDNG